MAFPFLEENVAPVVWCLAEGAMIDVVG